MNHKLLLLLFFGFLCGSCSTELHEDVALEYNNLPHNLDFNLHVKADFI